MGTVLARLIDAGVRHGSQHALWGIDLEVVAGRQLAVLGPSGAGKSTLLKLLTREVRPTSGSVETGRTGLREGVVRQDPLLFAWLTIRENVSLGQTFRANQAEASRVDEALSLLGISELADRYPDEVSGGQAQRAAFARALAITPDLLILDEPFSALDPAIRAELQRWLRTTLTERRQSSVLVTHDIDEALIVADDIVVLTHGRLTHRWQNPTPATDDAEALVHPLRAELRAAYDTGWEPGDEEWSGTDVATVGKHRA